jgi:glycosyltransferase involved in cell wall biosynthesis
MTGYGHYAIRVIRGLLALNLPACLNALEMEPEEVDTDLRELLYCPRPEDWQLLFTPLNGLDSFEITDRTVVLTTWESETILPEWARALNRAALVIVPCRWNKDCFRRAGVTTRIETVGLGYDPANFRPCHGFPDLCTFGFAAALTGGGVRKNVEGLLRAFTLAFPQETDVRLRIKLTPRCPWPVPVADPRVEVVRAYLADRELCEWYTSLTAFVNPSRAEAWGLHLLEAMATGRPIISTPYSGVTEYFDESVGYPVAYRLVRASCDVYQGVWAEPELGSLRDRLRQVYRNRVEAERLGRAAALRAAQFSWHRMSERIANLLQEIGVVAR